MHISFVLCVIYQLMIIYCTPIMFAVMSSLCNLLASLFGPLLSSKLSTQTLYFSLGVKDETSESYNVTEKVTFC
jgi:uncharacterized protein involved in cysteine biosynthesis